MHLLLIKFFHVFKVKGNAASERVGNSIYIHRIEISYSVRENPGNNNGPDESGVGNALAGS